MHGGMYEEPGGGMNMLEICNLTKKYDKEKGIFDLSYSFEEGKIYALVGPNGAGKTTLIQMISGISEPMKGQIRLDDQDTLLRKSKSQIGYALELTGNNTKQTVLQFLRMVCDIKFGGEHKEDIMSFLTDFELEIQVNNLTNHKIRQLRDFDQTWFNSIFEITTSYLLNLKAH